MSRVLRASAALAALVIGAAGCRDLDRFSTNGGSFEGAVVRGNFVRAGIAEDARLCLTLDAQHLQDSPGSISTSDGRFKATPLRPIPQIWHDPLSTLSFGDGREKNLVYMATTSAPYAQDVMVILSLMHEGDVEVRLIRGAPQADAGPAPSDPMFGVFSLAKRDAPCS